jgi:hypothetical protein
MATIEKIAEIFKNKYTEWEANPKRFESGYDYEQTYAEMMQVVQKEVFKMSVGKVSKDRNKKKTCNPIWQY